MLVIKNAQELKTQLQILHSLGNSIGFVPTMGALHAGHLSLVEASTAENDVTVMSIFVNPTQFNNAEDLKKYPRTLINDLELLQGSSCDIIYAPEVEDVYPHGTLSKMEIVDLSAMNSVQEGKLRPGHFQGVVQVVDILLSTVTPDVLYLGAKDYQQCMVIQLLIQQKHPHVRLNICPTLREENGLAMSSRNTRLSASAKAQAAAIYQTMLFAQSQYATCSTLQDLDNLMHECTQKLSQFSEPEYFYISHAQTLQPLTDLSQPAVITVATWMEGVRLIDNMVINPSSH